jgi:protein-tyrosine phosphatase
MAHILIVCTANICRSPVVAELLRDRLRRRGLSDWTVTSAGTWAMEARAASRFSVEVMRANGFDITGHRARMVDEAMLAEADLVLCMETGHAEALRVEFPAQAGKIYMLTQMIDRNYSVADPYGGEYAEYERMFELVRDIIDGGLDRIIALARQTEAAR